VQIAVFLSVMLHELTVAGRVCDAGMKLPLLLVVIVIYSGGEVGASIERCPTRLPSTSAMRVFQDICYQFVSDERYWTSARDYCIQV